MKTCDECGDKHYAKGKCKLHYRMPSQINPKPIKKKGTPIGDYTMTSKQTVQTPKKTIKPKGRLEDKTLSELIKMADIVFSRYIKKRDSLSDGTFLCISCQQWKSKKEAQCGHYMPRTYSSLRFNPLNCSAECENCNCHDKNHLIGYRENLIRKIGFMKVEWLESHKLGNEHKWTREELNEIIQKYK